MTPYQEAVSLVEKFRTRDGYNIPKWLAQSSALIAVNLLIKHSKNIAEVYDLTFDESTSYYTKVKNEINKL